MGSRFLQIPALNLSRHPAVCSPAPGGARRRVMPRVCPGHRPRESSGVCAALRAARLGTGAELPSGSVREGKLAAMVVGPHYWRPQNVHHRVYYERLGLEVGRHGERERFLLDMASRRVGAGDDPPGDMFASGVYRTAVFTVTWTFVRARRSDQYVGAGCRHASLETIPDITAARCWERPRNLPHSYRRRHHMPIIAAW